MALRVRFLSRRSSRPLYLSVLLVIIIIFILVRIGGHFEQVQLKIKRLRNGPCRERHLFQSQRENEGIYIDVGTGDGRSLRAFYEQGSLSPSRNAAALPCMYDPSKWRVVAFDADSRFTETLKDMKREYGFTLYSGTAAWHNDDSLSLNLEKVLRTINFSKWLSYNAAREDFVVLKMNIGGAEYEVLDKMLKDGTFCLVDVLIIDYHSRQVGRSDVLGPNMPNRVRKIASRRECDVEILYEAFAL